MNSFHLLGSAGARVRGALSSEPVCWQRTRTNLSDVWKHTHRSWWAACKQVIVNRTVLTVSNDQRSGVSVGCLPIPIQLRFRPENWIAINLPGFPAESRRYMYQCQVLSPRHLWALQDGEIKFHLINNNQKRSAVIWKALIPLVNILFQLQLHHFILSFPQYTIALSQILTRYNFLAQFQNQTLTKSVNPPLEFSSIYLLP